MISIIMRTSPCRDCRKRRHFPSGRPGCDRPGGGRHAEIEDKTGLIRRFEQFRGHLDAIRSAAEDIRTLNYRQYEDSRLTELADKITAEVSALKE